MQPRRLSTSVRSITMSWRPLSSCAGGSSAASSAIHHLDIGGADPEEVPGHDQVSSTRRVRFEEPADPEVTALECQAHGSFAGLHGLAPGASGSGNFGARNILTK